MKRIVFIFLIISQAVFCAGPGPSAAAQSEEKERKAGEAESRAGMVVTIMDENHPVNQELIKKISVPQNHNFTAEEQAAIADLIANKGANPRLLSRYNERIEYKMMYYAIICSPNIILLKKLIEVGPSKGINLGNWLGGILINHKINNVMDQIIDELISEYKKIGGKFNVASNEKGKEGQFFLDQFINENFYTVLVSDFASLDDFMHVIATLMREGARSAENGKYIEDQDIRKRVQQLQVKIDAENEARRKAVREEESLQLPRALRNLILQYEGSVESTPEQETVAEPVSAMAAQFAAESAAVGAAASAPAQQAAGVSVPEENFDLGD